MFDSNHVHDEGCNHDNEKNQSIQKIKQLVEYLKNAAQHSSENKEYHNWFSYCAQWVENQIDNNKSSKEDYLIKEKLININFSKKKIVVLGRGTAGSQAAAHVYRWMSDHEIEWHFDPSINTQAVGEGSTLDLPANLFKNISFRHEDLDCVDGSFKTGIYKKYWGETGKEFIHGFMPPATSYHFNAVALQDFIFEKLKSQIKVVKTNHKNSSEIDADLVIDCSGKPSNYNNYHISEYIAVNSVYVTQCYWDYARFQYTLTLARPYGWVFGIPLKNRCSIGYLFNNNINSLDEIKEDVKNVFKEFNLNPSKTTSHFNFESYVKNQNFAKHVSFNGNASFFLEPLEATSINAMSVINNLITAKFNNKISEEQANEFYKNHMEATETVIMLHYFSGSVFNTKFWEYAKDRGAKCIEDRLKNKKFKEIISHSLIQNLDLGKITDPPSGHGHYGSWCPQSFVQNIYGLELKDKLKNILI